MTLVEEEKDLFFAGYAICEKRLPFFARVSAPNPPCWLEGPFYSKVMSHNLLNLPWRVYYDIVISFLIWKPTIFGGATSCFEKHLKETQHNTCWL